MGINKNHCPLNLVDLRLSVLQVQKWFSKQQLGLSDFVGQESLGTLRRYIYKSKIKRGGGGGGDSSPWSHPLPTP